MFNRSKVEQQRFDDEGSVREKSIKRTKKNKHDEIFAGKNEIPS